MLLLNNKWQIDFQKQWIHNKNMNEYNQYLIPTVIEKTHYGERAYDIYSMLLKNGIVFLGTQITDGVANSIIAQLLFLDTQETKQDIKLYINSPGGSVPATLAIYDTMHHIKRDVQTICVGMAASGAALILAAGAKGKRLALPNSEILIHQVMAGGIEGQASEIAISAKHILSLKDRLNQILAKHTNQSLSKITMDTDRDYYMTAQEAKDYGIIDEIISTGRKTNGKRKK